MFSLIVATSQIAAAEHILCGEWKITNLSKKVVPGYLLANNPIIEVTPLKMTEREFTWPGCAPAAYTIKTIQDDDGLWLHLPRLECDNLPKDSGQGYLVALNALIATSSVAAAGCPWR